MSPDVLRQCIDALVLRYGSYRAAGAAAGIPASYLNRMRNGQHPRPSQKTLAKLMAAEGATP